MNLLDPSLFDRGGPLLWPLLALAVLGAFVFVERALYLHRRQIRPEDFVAGIKNALQQGRYVEALTLCEETPGPIANITKAGLLTFGGGVAASRAAMESAAMVEIPQLERRLGVFILLSKLGPLLGLLGTVLAVGQAFFALASGAQYPTLAVLALSVGQAVMSTAIGLMITIAAEGAHHLLFGRVRAIVQGMELVGHEVLTVLAALPPLTGPLLGPGAPATNASANAASAKPPLMP